MLVGYLYKTLVEVVLLPVTYRVIAAVKRRETLGDPLATHRTLSARGPQRGAGRVRRPGRRPGQCPACARRA